MAKQAQIAKDDFVKSNELEYEQKPFTHGSYRFIQAYPNNYGQAINLSAAQIPVTFQVPPEVINFSKSYLSFTVTIPAVANRYIWNHEDIIASGSIAHVQHYVSNSQNIVDLNFANNFYKACKKDISSDEQNTNDPLMGVYNSNSLNNVVPSLRTSASLGSAPGAVAIPVPSSKSFSETAYFSCGSLNTIVTKQFLLPLSLFKDTLFFMDKDIYYGVVSYIKLYFAQKDKIMFMSTSNVNPSISPEPVTSQPTINNLILMLAQEDNVDVANIVKQKFLNGMSFTIPYVIGFNIPASNNNQSITQQFDVGSGMSLMRVRYQVYNGVANMAEVLDTAYDCSNNATRVDGSDNSANMKILQFYTQLNSKRNQDITIDCTGVGGFTDYLSMKKHIDGSVLQNLNQYQYNWVWLEDFTGFGAKHEREGVQDHLLSGIPMGSTPLTYTFYGQNMGTMGALNANRQYVHYMWATFSKLIEIKAGNVSVRP